MTHSRWITSAHKAEMERNKAMIHDEYTETELTTHAGNWYKIRVYRSGVIMIHDDDEAFTTSVEDIITSIKLTRKS